LRELASNRLLLLRSKGVVVSDRWKRRRYRRQVGIEKMSESKPSEDASLRTQTLSKPRSPSSLGISLEDTCLLSRWQPVYRRHELNTGFDMERENLVFDAKGNDKRLHHREGEYLCKGRGAEPFVVVMNFL